MTIAIPGAAIAGARITVLDSIMGSGKTTFAIRHMNEAHEANLADLFAGKPGDRRFLYVTPLLSEVERVQDACPSLRFRDPQPVHGKKLFHLERLIEEGENVATTHSLFSLLSQRIYQLLRERNYTLILDEVLTCADHFSQMTDADKRMLFEGGYVYVEQATSRLRWSHERFPEYRGRFDQVRNLCDNGNLVAFYPKGKAVFEEGACGDAHGNDTEETPQQRSDIPTVILWQFPAEFLSCFRQVMVLTYLFRGAPMRNYLLAEGLSFKTLTIGPAGEPVAWSEHVETAAKEKLRGLVTIYEGKLNDIGRSTGKENPLSSSWFKRATLATKGKLRRATISFFEYSTKTPSAANAWTTFKDHKAKLAGTRYGRESNWIPLNAKATNEYIDKQSLAYLANRFSLPLLRQYFESRGIEVDEDAYALSEMIQWVWRSCIRRGDPISLFIPSDRMRGLLKVWLGA